LLWLLLLLLRAPATTAQTTHVDTLRIALLMPERESRTDSSLVAGVKQGLFEATRAAALFGGAVSVIPSTMPPLNGVESVLRQLRLRGVSAVIANTSCDALSEGSQKNGVLFVDAGCADSSDHETRSLTVHVWPSAAERAAALSGAAADVRARTRVVVWDSTLERFGADQLNQRFRAATGTAMTPEAWSGWVAVKILWEASLRVHSVDPAVLARTLLTPTTHFDGHKGSALSFRATDHRLAQPFYLIFEQNGARKVVDVESCHSSARRACQ